MIFSAISYYGGRFVDENYQIKHDKAGILTTANFGGINCNDSRFIITLGPSSWYIINII
jgi:peptidylprolyl isomerase